MGNDTFVSNVIACKDGISISLANTQDYEVEILVDVNVIGLAGVIAQGNVSVKLQPKLLTGLPRPGSPSTILPSETYYYGTTEIPWPTGFIPSLGTQFHLSGYDGHVGYAPNNGMPVFSEDCLLFSNPDAPNFMDARIDAYHPWQSVAAYCEDKMVKIYGIDANAIGYFAFAVTQEDIDKLGIPNENVLLASAPSSFGGNIRLYKLKDTGELQINAPGLPPESWKEYVFTWAGCS
ncbi:MAG: hypothetical protein GC179_05360 [Anaerolineaceae bacterium]|nr:hypothetical protein [Anaerolineaceae bacterium]